MKKITLVFCLSIALLISFGQDNKFSIAMKSKITEMDTASQVNSLMELAAQFERIADAEKTEWLPYYYAALARINIGYILAEGRMGIEKEIDPIADKAEELIIKAEKISSKNSEIFILRKMNASLRLRADPFTRYMVYGPEAEKALLMAKKLNPENPRVYLLEGIDQFDTPEQFGGSKAKAKLLFTLAIKKYKAFIPNSNIDPAWGENRAGNMLSQIK